MSFHRVPKSNYNYKIARGRPQQCVAFLPPLDNDVNGCLQLTGQTVAPPYAAASLPSHPRPSLVNIRPNPPSKPKFCNPNKMFSASNVPQQLSMGVPYPSHFKLPPLDVAGSGIGRKNQKRLSVEELHLHNAQMEQEMMRSHAENENDSGLPDMIELNIQKPAMLHRVVHHNSQRMKPRDKSYLPPLAMRSQQEMPKAATVYLAEKSAGAEHAFFQDMYNESSLPPIVAKNFNKAKGDHMRHILGLKTKHVANKDEDTEMFSRNELLVPVPPYAQPKVTKRKNNKRKVLKDITNVTNKRT